MKARQVPTNIDCFSFACRRELFALVLNIFPFFHAGRDYIFLFSRLYTNIYAALIPCLFDPTSTLDKEEKEDQSATTTSKCSCWLCSMIS